MVLGRDAGVGREELVFLQEQGWLCLGHGCCREMANVTVLILQQWICSPIPPPPFS